MRYITFYLIAAMTVVFILQMSVAGLTDNFALVSSEALARPWILLTSVFLHGSVSHLLSNMIALGFFGFVLENITGSRRFMAIFIGTGIISSAASLSYESSLGASGAIFGVIGALAAIRPRMMVYAFGIPMPMFVAAIFWAFLDFAGTFYPSNIANAAHLAGMASGLAIGFALRKEFKESRRGKENPLSENEIDEWEDRYMR